MASGIQPTRPHGVPANRGSNHAHSGHAVLGHTTSSLPTPRSASRSASCSGVCLSAGMRSTSHPKDRMVSRSRETWAVPKTKGTTVLPPPCSMGGLYGTWIWKGLPFRTHKRKRLGGGFSPSFDMIRLLCRQYPTPVAHHHTHGTPIRGHRVFVPLDGKGAAIRCAPHRTRTGRPVREHRAQNLTDLRHVFRGRKENELTDALTERVPSNTARATGRMVMVIHGLLLGPATRVQPNRLSAIPL